jgi:hypothetical protein
VTCVFAGSRFYSHSLCFDLLLLFFLEYEPCTSPTSRCPLSQVWARSGPCLRTLRSARGVVQVMRRGQ